MPELEQPLLIRQELQPSYLQRAREFMGQKASRLLVAGLSVVGTTSYDTVPVFAEEVPSADITLVENVDSEDTRVAAWSVTKIHATDIPGQTIIGNLTETNASLDGFITAFPCAEGKPDPLTSNLNFKAGMDVANSVTVKADSSGDICLSPNVATDLIWDQAVETDVFAAHNAVRKLDSRNAGGTNTRVAAWSVTKIRATDVPGQTIIANLTETNAVANGFITAYPCDEGLPNPLTSNLNFKAGYDTANSVTVKSDGNGDVCLTPNVATDLIWDQVVETDAFEAHNAVRKLDTRTSGGAAVRVAGGSVTRVHATEIPGQTIIGNLTETNATADGFVTAFPCDEGLPNPLTSNLNFKKGFDVANSVTVKADSSGDICLSPNVATDLIWDQAVETSAFDAHNADRKLDTREGELLEEGVVLLSTSGESPILPSQLKVSCYYIRYPNTDFIRKGYRILYGGLSPNPTFDSEALVGDKIGTEFTVGSSTSFSYFYSATTIADRDGNAKFEASNSDSTVASASKLEVNPLIVTKFAVDGRISVSRFALNIVCIQAAEYPY